LFDLIEHLGRLPTEAHQGAEALLLRVVNRKLLQAEGIEIG
jgi:hypothetical protein